MDSHKGGFHQRPHYIPTKKWQGGIKRVALSPTLPTLSSMFPVHVFGEASTAVVVFLHRLVGVEVAGRDEWCVGRVHRKPILQQLLQIQPVGEVGFVPAAPLKHCGLYE